MGQTRKYYKYFINLNVCAAWLPITPGISWIKTLKQGKNTTTNIKEE